MFICKFSQVSSDSTKFKANRHGEMPMIGDILAGTAFGSIMDGTMFQRENLEEGKLYACENILSEYEGKKQWRVKIICPVTFSEFLAEYKKLGAGKLITTSVEDEIIEPEPTTQTAKVGGKK